MEMDDLRWKASTVALLEACVVRVELEMHVFRSSARK